MSGDKSEFERWCQKASPAQIMATDDAILTVKMLGYRIVKLDQRYPDDTADPMSYAITDEL